jgi:outer membrane protein assembly factor BamB
MAEVRFPSGVRTADVTSLTPEGRSKSDGVSRSYVLCPTSTGIGGFVVVRARGLRVWVVAGVVVAAVTGVLGGVASAQPSGFNARGDVLIGDQFNNRVIEVNGDHQVVWRFGDGSSVAGPRSVVAPNDAERVGSLTLIAGTGAPAGAEPSCPSGCPDNRVFLVNRAGRIVWQYGHAGVTGSGRDQLNTPVFSLMLPNRDVLIVDQGNQRVIEVTPDHRIVWQYGQTGTAGAGFDQLNNPNSAELLRNGHVLIADENNNRVIEVTRDHRIVWHYGSPSTPATLSGAAFASRLANGDTLITDSNNNRVIQVTPDAHVAWMYRTNMRPGSVANPLPTRAVRLRNGDTLISDQFNGQVIQVDPNHTIDWAQGKVGVNSLGFDRLNAPYDAVVIGDYTGLTPPPN